MKFSHLMGLSTGLFLAFSTQAQTNVTLNLSVGGKPKSTVVHVPSNADKPPVVFFVHGANGTGPNFQRETNGDATADREKFIAVYPSAGGNNIWDDMFGTGNFPFFLAILDTLDARYKIDRDRVYMTGFSQGGMISYAAACYYSEVFAAVAPVSGHGRGPCTIKRPVPVFMTFGTQEGSSSFMGDRDLWLGLNKCPSTAPTLTKPYPANKTNSKAGRAVYSNCAEGSSVVIDSITGQGHQWPSASNLNQADEVWAFFKQYSLKPDPTPALQSKPAPSHGSFMAFYQSGVVRLSGLDFDCKVSVTNAKGQVVANVNTVDRQFSFKDKPSGIYWVRLDNGSSASPQKLILP
jgi:poly(3-hydroxybutyrate) depolymerase